MLPFGISHSGQKTPRPKMREPREKIGLLVVFGRVGYGCIQALVPQPSNVYEKRFSHEMICVSSLSSSSPTERSTRCLGLAKAHLTLVHGGRNASFIIRRLTWGKAHIAWTGESSETMQRRSESGIAKLRLALFRFTRSSYKFVHITYSSPREHAVHRPHQMLRVLCSIAFRPCRWFVCRASWDTTLLSIFLARVRQQRACRLERSAQQQHIHGCWWSIIK